MMTRKERDVFNYVCEFCAKNEYMPTLREIAAGMGMSPKSFSSISYRLNSLVRQGKIARNGKRFDLPKNELAA